MKQITILFLLALITSCNNESDIRNNSTLITLERQVQLANQNEFERGNSFYFEIKDLHLNSSTDRISQVSIFLHQMKRIDKESYRIINEIDQLKLEFLKGAKENVSVSSYNTVIHLSDMRHFGNEIMHLNLNAIKDKMNVDAVENVLFNRSKDMRIWKSYKVFTTNLLEALATYKIRNQKFSFKPKQNYKGTTFDNQFKSFKTDLKHSKINLSDDEAVLTELFVNLFKPETVVGEDGSEFTWMEYTFKNKTIIEAISELTSLQNSILKARSSALRHVRSRLALCGYYSFNKFLPVVEGVSNAKIGEEVEIKVRMAAYDTYENPMITVSNPGTAVFFRGDGSATLVFKAKKGVNRLKGELMIKKKTGEIFSKPWEWEVYGIEK